MKHLLLFGIGLILIDIVLMKKLKLDYVWTVIFNLGLYLMMMALR